MRRLPLLLATALLLMGCAALPLTGRGEIAGRVMAEEEPVAGVLVTATDETGRSAAVWSDAEGYYRFDPLPRGLYRVGAEKMGAPFLVTAWGVSEVAVRAGSPAWVGLKLVPRESPRYAPYQAPTPGFGAVAGRALHEGQPLSGAVANLYLDRAEGLKGPGFRQSPPTGKDGVFAFDDLPEGEYFLAVRLRKSGGAGPVREGDLYGVAAAPLKVRGDEECRIDVHLVKKEKERPPHAASLAAEGTALAGWVVDAQGEPVAGVYVFAYRDRIIGHKMPDFLSAPTGPDGLFLLPLGEGGLFYVGAREEFGGSPRPGERFGLYEGSADHGIRVAPGKRVEGIEIPVHQVLRP